jgi:enamine deaminase RidA (YjgF/YER057c/UK114 family)
MPLSIGSHGTPRCLALIASVAYHGGGMTDRIRVVDVPGFPSPTGYANGIVASGQRLYVAGQIGWDEHKRIVSDDIGQQFAKALDNVLAVVRAAGGQPTDIVRMTIYITDVDGYTAARHTLSQAWRDRFGRYYPAVALVGVARLLEAHAKVEIEATAELS